MQEQRNTRGAITTSSNVFVLQRLNMRLPGIPQQRILPPSGLAILSAFLFWTLQGGAPLVQSFRPSRPSRGSFSQRSAGATPTTARPLSYSSVVASVDPWAFPWVAPASASESASTTTTTNTSPGTTPNVLRYQDDTAERSAVIYNDSFQSSPSRAGTPTRYRVYCDLDGVLVDFAAGIRHLYPHHSHAIVCSQSVDALHRPTMWERVSAHGDFFGSLPWLPQGQRLWQALQPLQPDILTGVPGSVQGSSRQKFRWCQRELGVAVQHVDQSSLPHALVSPAARQAVCRVITCWSARKHVQSGPNAVLIDDRIDLKAAWEAKGGIFVHHTGCADTTLQELRHLGILQPHHEAEQHQDRLLP